MENIVYFNLMNDGDTATVRIFNTTTDKIETALVHYLQVGDKKNVVKCCGENCPMCNRKVASAERIYLHLWDYRDNTEKVWDRTPTIMQQLDMIAKSWGNLSDVVLQITRHGKDFPRYDIQVMPPNSYSKPNIKIDEKVAYRFYKSRSVDEIEEFYRTGVLPKHKSS